MLVQTAYLSQATRPLDDNELIKLLETSRAKNFRRGVGGLLLYREGSFLQILEGRAVEVESLLQTIQRDTRHTDVRIILRQDVSERVFVNWRMGFITPEALIQAHPAFSHALAHGQNTLEARFVQDLIALFRTGALSDSVSDG